MIRQNRSLLIWLAALLLAIGTHKLGWNFISVPLTLGVIGAGFIITQVEFVSSQIKRRHR